MIGEVVQWVFVAYTAIKGFREHIKLERMVNDSVSTVKQVVFQATESIIWYVAFIACLLLKLL